MHGRCTASVKMGSAVPLPALVLQAAQASAYVVHEMCSSALLHNIVDVDGFFAATTSKKITHKSLVKWIGTFT